MIRREKRRQSNRTYSVARKRPCLETGSLEAPVTPDSTVMDDLGTERSDSSGHSTPERLQNEESSTPPPLIDLSDTPQQEEPTGNIVIVYARKETKELVYFSNCSECIHTGLNIRVSQRCSGSCWNRSI
jgi:hypothetical protein